MEILTGDIGRIIELAIAPAFLLTGVGANLTVLTNRLARIIDRSRILEDRINAATSDQPDSIAELSTLYQRAYLINRAITLSTSSALLVCLVIATLFMGGALNVSLSTTIAVMFILCMVTLVCSFIYLLREIFVATSTLSMRPLINIKR